ncbi:MAG TPA: SRPBCC family protein [Dissulfurispiraceae bacterium]|nr:SRPBCC family protein [Dissulfurispiraceae bacterium]
MIAIRFPHIEIGRVIRTPLHKVWDLITDTGRWPLWGPSVSAVVCADRRIRKGSKGRIRTSVGLWLPFEITQFEECSRWSWRVAGIEATGHRLEARGDDLCALFFSVPLPAFPYLLICHIALKRIARIAEARIS